MTRPGDGPDPGLAVSPPPPHSGGRVGVSRLLALSDAFVPFPVAPFWILSPSLASTSNFILFPGGGEAEESAMHYR